MPGRSANQAVTSSRAFHPATGQAATPANQFMALRPPFRAPRPLALRPPSRAPRPLVLRPPFRAPQPLALRPLLAVLLFMALLAPPAGATSAPSLLGRIRVDGSTSDFTADEAVFGMNATAGLPEESDVDSRWQDNDVSQVYITWDADSVYFAGTGVINGNNMILLFDVGNPDPGIKAETGADFDGLSRMTDLNSWRRNFVFANGFFPDFFAATWDGNTTPRLLTATGANQVVDEVPATAGGGSGSFRAAATFQGTQAGRAMEFSIPWWKFFCFSSAERLERRFVPELGDTLSVLPSGVRSIRLAGVITAGGDGTGGPDSAPDNLQGHEVDSGVQVTIDNFAILDLDALNNVTGAAGPDGLPDFNVEPKSRVSFLVPPPVRAMRFEVQDFRFNRPSFAPERGERISYSFRLSIPPGLSDLEAGYRKVSFSAGIFDARGRLVRRLYGRDDSNNPPRPLTQPVIRALDEWDGRDADGRIVDGGIYILRLILEPDQSRLTRAFGVVR